MKPTLEQLKQIAEIITARMRAMSESEARDMFVMEDYHGFGCAQFPNTWLVEATEPLGINPLDIELELIKVDHDLTDQVHLHRASTAVTVCLGSKEHVSPPIFAQAFLKDHWFDIAEGDVVAIPPETPHGFTVKEGGSLTFLSVQSPPIVGNDGHDDYVRLEI